MKGLAHKSSFLLLFFVIILLCLVSKAYPASESVFATHTYRMGDNDSKNDARHICFIEAKRKVIEKAGSYVTSFSKIKNFQLTEDEVTTFSAALLSVETTEEKWQDMAVTLTVRAIVDTNLIEKQLIRIQNDLSLQGKIKKQQSQIEALEKNLSMLRNNLANVDSIKATPLRTERNIIFKKIDELETTKIEIIERIQKRSRDAKKHIINGMTYKDVKDLLGEPDGKQHTYVDQSDWYYGDTLVRFNDAGIVKGIY